MRTFGFKLGKIHFPLALCRCFERDFLDQVPATARRTEPQAAALSDHFADRSK